MSKIDGSVLKWMLHYLTVNQINCGHGRHETAVSAVSQAYQDNYPGNLEWKTIRQHGHVAAKKLSTNSHIKGDKTLKIDITKIASLSDERLEKLIKARAGTDSAVLPLLTKEWNTRISNKNKRTVKLVKKTPKETILTEAIETILRYTPEERRKNGKKYMINLVK